MSEASVQLGYRDTRLEVHADSADELQWLVEFLWPSFQAVEGGPIDHTIELLVSPARYGQLREGWPGDGPLVDCFTLDGSFERLPARRLDAAQMPDGVRNGPVTGIVGSPSADPTEALLVLDTRSDAILLVHRGGERVQIIARQPSDRVRLAVMRVLRELATTAQLRRGGLALHAAAFCVGERAVVAAGVKRSGKTSLLLSALRSGCGFLANDRVYVDTEEAVPSVRGMPTIIKVRTGSLSLFPDFAQRVSRASLHRGLTLAEAASLSDPAPMTFGPEIGPSLNATQLCHLLNASGRSAAPLEAILFPTVLARTKGMRWERLSEAAALALYPGAVLGAATPRRVSEVFTGSGRAPLLSGADERRIWKSLVARIPCWRCILGEGAFASTYERVWKLPFDPSRG